MNWFDFCSIFVDPKPEFKIGEFGIAPPYKETFEGNRAWLAEVQFVDGPVYLARETMMKRDEKTGLFIVDHDLTLPIDKYHPGHQPYTHGGVPFKRLRKLTPDLVDLENVEKYKSWCNEWEKVHAEWLRNDGPRREMSLELEIHQLKELNEVLAENLKRTSSPQSA